MIAWLEQARKLNQAGLRSSEIATELRMRIERSRAFAIHERLDQIEANIRKAKQEIEYGTTGKAA